MDKQTLVINDGKSGKYRPDDNDAYMLQLDLYAAAGVVQFPSSREVHTRLLYTDHGIKFPVKGPAVYTVAQAKASQKEWERRVKPMFADKRFVATPGYYCSWCPYSKNKNGPCRY